VTRYLLDTNVISGLMREPQGRIFERIQAVGVASIYTSIVVAGELRFGAAKRASERLAVEVEAILGRIIVAPLGPTVDRIYAEIRRRLEVEGRSVGANDLWIASQALHDGSVVVTDNAGEFSRIAGLNVENWVRD
jgi:tRNA(fMet)-specific endonuclease VapC